MPPVTGIVDIKRRMVQGKGFHQVWLPATNATPTAANAASGHFGNTINPGSVGTTMPGTMVGFPIPNTTDDLRGVCCVSYCSAVESMWLGYFYRFGTADLTSTSGNRLTHDGTFTRLRRTVFGTANTNIGLIPVLQVLTASSVTVCSYTITYNDQDGVSTTSPTNQLPAAATNNAGTYNLILDEADCNVLDITALNVSVATTGGTAALWGFEPLMKVSAPGVGMGSYDDALYGGLRLPPFRPATPDSGSVTSVLGFLCPTTLITTVAPLYVMGVNNA